ncbi:uncharacterized protein LOC144488611 [Mustelus asterias]
MDTPGKWFQSPLSDGARVTELGDLRRASIALERDDEVFGAKRSVTVTCEAPPQESGRKFYLYRNGETLPLLREKARRGSLSVTFDLTGRLRSGTEYYQCADRRELWRGSRSAVTPWKSATCEINGVSKTAPTLTFPHGTESWEGGE